MSVTKEEFFKYIGDEHSLSGYTRSYKLVLYKILIDDVLYQRRSYVTKVAEKFKQFYLERKEFGKIADKDVDIKIANIENSTIEQVISVIIANPYKHIHENGFLHIWQDEKQNSYFVFDTVLLRTITNGEWLFLLMNIRKKINLYFSRIDGVEKKEDKTQIATQVVFTDEKNGQLVHMDFSAVSSFTDKNYVPAILVIDNYIYRLNSWEELFKIYFYSASKATAGYEFFTSICGEYVSGFGRRISKDETRFGDPCKFAKDMYVECLKTKAPVHLLDTYKYASLNLHFIKYVKDVLAIDFDLWLCKVDNKKDMDKDCNALIAELSPKRKRNKLKVVKTKNFIAHINEEVLSDAEKFYLRIEKEYDKKILLGDIIIDSDEENILKQYMQSELRSLDNFGTRFKPRRMKIFAFGLVRFAMKYYSEGKFWPFFKDEYGIAVKANNQHEIHDWFSFIMKNTGKTYDDKLPQKIDNISLHSFVTDKCSKQFFDYLFDFWRRELNRNIDNMYGEGNELFKALIGEIKLNNSVGINNVMKHTSMALELNEKSCKLRIRRYLKLMDECFWNGDTIPETGNRFNELLRKWMAIPNGKFQSEYRIKIREKGVRGQKLLSKPQLQVKYINSSFSLRLPREILPHCTTEEHPFWKIDAEGMEPIIISPDLMMGSVFLYTEETEAEMPAGMLFKRISITLYSERRRFVTFSIKADEVRFFNEDGKYIDHSVSLPTGNLFCYSVVEEIPQILYKDKQTPQLAGNMFVGIYQAEKGDIVLLHNNHAVQVGEKINEGLNGDSKVDGVEAISGDDSYYVYSKLPKILFKAPKEKISGVMIKISGIDRPYRLTDYNYHEFKLDDSLDEIYAYIIDLKDFIAKEGCYQIEINIPNSLKQYVYYLCYIKDFAFKYLNAPYIFSDTGSICFDKKLNFEIKDDELEQEDNIKLLNLNFNPASAEFSSDYIEDWKLKLNYKLSSEIISLKFDIPIFLWKYKKEAEWAINKPADIFLKDLPNKLYVKGPFSFNDKGKNKLFLDLKNAGSEDTDMFAEPVRDEGYFVFPFSNFKSWLNQDIVKRQIKLKLDNYDYSFLDVYCRSIVLSHNLTGDFEAGKIYGNFDIVGDGEYTVSIKKGNEIIAGDIPIIDGKFSYEAEFESGNYQIIIFEIYEDETGFGALSIQIAQFTCYLTNPYNLSGLILKFDAIQDIEKKYKPILFARHYYIINLQKKSVEQIESEGKAIIGIWNSEIDIYDYKFKKHTCIYEGQLGYYEGKEFIFEFQALICFYNPKDLQKVIILRESDGEYVELLRDAKNEILLKNDKDISKRMKEWYVRLLPDDKFTFAIEILSDFDQILSSPTINNTLSQKKEELIKRRVN